MSARGPGPAVALRGCIAALLVAGLAGAAPSRWDRALDPTLGPAERLLRDAVRARTPSGFPPEFPLGERLERALAARVLLLLRQSGEDAPDHPGWLRFLGETLIASETGREAEARAVLRRALALRPDAHWAARAWFQVAIASHRLGEGEVERAAYTEALAFEWDEERRALVHLNRGESRMLAGDLDGAVADYEQAVELAHDAEVHALALWGLAVALARAGELPRALLLAYDADAARFPGAGGAPARAIDLPNVFFAPAHEIEAYRALAAMARAERAAEEAARRAALVEARGAWDAYLEGARRGGDRYADRAAELRRACERRLSRSRRR